MMRIRKKQELPEDALIKEIQRTRMALETAYSNFENCLDPDLIDSYIYEVNAAQKRYKFLLKQVKTLETENYA
ncbi:MAG: YaaL family protein [bacterium]|nr:YaaL family protein [bacterium]